jgi:1-aminocyclopropane-1-carboxylate deaminase/D-cysteine desulfhydrase-like pyridoxal-dependent ACC family enzyme
VRRNKEIQAPRVLARCSEISELLGTPEYVTTDDIILNDVPLAPGYGLLNPLTIEALKLAASLEGLLLDPVYTGKAMAGVIDRVRTNTYDNGTNVLFLHTGGQPSLFAYESELTAALELNK